jgi:hypothetical protein
MKKVVRKEATVSQVGQALLAGQNRSHLAIEEIKNLSFIVASLPQYRDDKEVIAYRHFMLKTHKGKDQTHVEANSTPYAGMLKKFRERILDDDLNWLQENDIKIAKKGAKAELPLSAAYEWCLKNDEDKANDMEATLFLIFKYLDDEKLSDHKKLVEICTQFKKNEKEEAGAKAIQNIVGKVRANAPTGNAPPNTNDVMNIVRTIIGGSTDGEGSDMHNLAQGIMTGKITIPQLVEQVKSSITITEDADVKEAVEAKAEASDEE